MRDSKREKITIGKIWGIIYPMLVYLGISFVIQLAMMILIGVFAVVSGEITDQGALTQYLIDVTYEQVLLLTLLSGLGTIPFLIFFYRRDIRKEKLENKYVRYKRENIGKYLLIIPFGIFNMLWANLFVSLLTLIMPDFMLESYASTETAIYGSSFAMQLLTAGIVAPIVEELIFRGLVYKRLKKMTGLIVAAVLSALLFGIFHGNWVQAPYAMILGLVCVFVYEKYKSVIAPILLHMSANVFAVILSSGAGDSSTAETVQIDTVEYVVSLIIVIVITSVLAAITGLIIWFVVHPRRVETDTHTTGSTPDGNVGDFYRGMNNDSDSQGSDTASTDYFSQEQKKEEKIDMETTFYYQGQDNNPKNDNEN